MLGVNMIKSRKLHIAKGFLTAVAIVALTGCAPLFSTVKHEFDIAHTIHYTKMADIKGDIGDYTIYLDKADTLPVTVNIDSEFASAKDSKINLVLKKRLYFWIDFPKGIESMNENEKQKALKKVRVLVSGDAKTWASTSGGIDVLKQALGIKTGSLTIGASITKESGIGLEVGVFTNR